MASAAIVTIKLRGDKRGKAVMIFFNIPEGLKSKIADLHEDFYYMSGRQGKSTQIVANSALSIVLSAGDSD